MRPRRGAPVCGHGIGGHVADYERSRRAAEGLGRCTGIATGHRPPAGPLEPPAPAGGSWFFQTHPSRREQGEERSDVRRAAGKRRGAVGRGPVQERHRQPRRAVLLGAARRHRPGQGHLRPVPGAGAVLRDGPGPPGAVRRVGWPAVLQGQGARGQAAAGPSAQGPPGHRGDRPGRHGRHRHESPEDPIDPRKCPWEGVSGADRSRRWLRSADARWPSGSAGGGWRAAACAAPTTRGSPPSGCRC